MNGMWIKYEQIVNKNATCLQICFCRTTSHQCKVITFFTMVLMSRIDVKRPDVKQVSHAVRPK